MASESQKIRVLLMEDHVIFRQSLVEVLSREDDMTVVGAAGSVAEVLPLLSQTLPDVLILELRLPGADGLKFLSQLHGVSPRTRPIIFSHSQDPRDVVESLRSGARGYLPKKSPTATVLACIRRVAAGEIYLENPQLEVIVHALQDRGRKGAGGSALSPREKEIVQLVLAGCKNKEIASRLGISEKTVKNHLSSVFDKLGVNDRLELALYVLEKKLLE